MVLSDFKHWAVKYLSSRPRGMHKHVNLEACIQSEENARTATRSPWYVGSAQLEFACILQDMEPCSAISVMAVRSPKCLQLSRVQTLLHVLGLNLLLHVLGLDLWIRTRWEMGFYYLKNQNPVLCSDSVYIHFCKSYQVPSRKGLLLFEVW